MHIPGTFDLSELNPPQKEAVLHDTGPLLVLAGAGSGKTRVITYRIAQLIHRGVRPAQILAVTFTNKAAGEMRERLSTMIGSEVVRRSWIGTFHSLAARMLRIEGKHIGISSDFVIYDSSDQKSVVNRVLKDLDLKDNRYRPSAVLSFIDRAKNSGILAKDYVGDDYFTRVVERIYPRYEDYLAQANALDFGNLLLKANELVQCEASSISSRFKYILVDEFQDTNRVQYDIVRGLCGRAFSSVAGARGANFGVSTDRGHDNLCVVGDDDQSIYSWRGADMGNILGFEKDFAGSKSVKLEQNYRSTQTILDAAGAIIAKNTGRKKKTLWTDRGEGEKVQVVHLGSESIEANYIAHEILSLMQRRSLSLSDIAIFYRTHAQSRALEHAFRSASLPYRIVGGLRFFERQEIKDALAYLRLSLNYRDDVSFQRILNVPKRGIGKSSLEKIAAYARFHGTSLMQAAIQLVDQPNIQSKMQGAADGSQVKISAALRKKLAVFIEAIEAQSESLLSLKPSEVTEHWYESSGYQKMLGQDTTPESDTRQENIAELIGSMRAYEEMESEPTLVGYLEQVALSTGLDEADSKDGLISMMTVHSAKGLEFPVVFVVGMEQDVFPHARSRDNLEEMEEERRLAYVAYTRARDLLYLTLTARRFLSGRPQINPPSPFVLDLPEELVHYQRVQVEGGGHGFAGRSAGRRPFQTVHNRSNYPGLRLVSGSGSCEGSTSNLSSSGPDDLDQRSAEERSDLGQSPVETAQPAKPGLSLSSSSRIRVGMTVSHSRFGSGQIKWISGKSPRANLTIFFPDVGCSKTIREDFITV